MLQEQLEWYQQKQKEHADKLASLEQEEQELLQLLAGITRPRSSQHGFEDDRASMSLAVSNSGVKNVLGTLQTPDMLQMVLANLSPDTSEEAKILDAGIRQLLQHIRAKGLEPPSQPRRQSPGGEPGDTEMLWPA